MSSNQTTQFYPAWDTKTAQILTILVLTTGLALGAVALRLYVRISIVKSVGWDDYTIIGAAVRNLQGYAFSSS